MRHGRRGDVDVAKIFYLVVVLTLGYLAWSFLPAYYGRFSMDRAVQDSILDWRDRLSMVKAKDTLNRRMDKYNVPDYVWPQDCEFYEKFEERHIDCYWVVEIDYPLIEKSTELEFAIHKYLDKGDLMHDIEVDLSRDK